MIRGILSIKKSLLLAICVSAACGQNTVLPVAEKNSTITNGSYESGYPAVGMLWHCDESYQLCNSCTATLIAPTAILTAAHCVYPNGTAIFSPGDGNGNAYLVYDSVIYPSYIHAIDTLSVDLAIGFLSESIADIAPAEVTSTEPTAGDRVTIVGFGTTGADESDSGTKRSAQNAIDEVSDGFLFISESSGPEGSFCYGDSGGPTFVRNNSTEVVVGVHSRGNCDSTFLWFFDTSSAIDVSVYSYMPWIKSVLDQPPTDLNRYPIVEVPQLYVASSFADEMPATFPLVVIADDERTIEKMSLSLDSTEIHVAYGPRLDISLSNVPLGLHTISVEALDDQQQVVSRIDLQFTVVETVEDSVAATSCENDPAACNSPSYSSSDPAQGEGCRIAPRGGGATPPKAWTLLLLLWLYGMRHKRRHGATALRRCV